MSFKDSSIFSTGGHFVQKFKKKQIVHYCRVHYEEHFYKIILNLDWWFRRCCLKTIQL